MPPLEITELSLAGEAFADELGLTTGLKLLACADESLPSLADMHGLKQIQILSKEEGGCGRYVSNHPKALLYAKIEGKVAKAVTCGRFGSGFAADGRSIFTAAHCLDYQMRDVMVQFGSDSEHVARVVAIDREADVAALRLPERLHSLEGLSLRSASQMQTGEWLGTIGHPETVSDRVFSEGSLMAPDYQNPRYQYQVASSYRRSNAVLNFDIPVRPGNSGGVVFDEYGNVAGLVNMTHGGVFGGLGTSVEHLKALAAAVQKTDELGDTDIPAGSHFVRSVVSSDGTTVAHAGGVQEFSVSNVRMHRQVWDRASDNWVPIGGWVPL